MNFLKPISISLSPNTEKDDVRTAFKLLFQPWLWIAGDSPQQGEEDKSSSSPFAAARELEEVFKNYLGAGHAVSFNSGRSAAMAIFSSLDLEKGDEVLLQSFTCNAAVNPIVWAGLKPVYVDCDEKTFNIDIEDLKKKITPQTKAVMVQHTFGKPAEMDDILKICQQYNLILIEDCAHSLGASYRGKKVGTFGKAAFFSFSRDKVISSVYGGMALTDDPELGKRIREYQEKAGFPSYFWVKQQLLHPVLMNWLILPTYRFPGKYFLILFQWLHILSKAVHWKEKRAKRPGYFPKRLPNALAVLALKQFGKLERFNNHRRGVAEFYIKELSNSKYSIPDAEYCKDSIFLRFSVSHPKAREIIRQAWRKNLLIGDWYTIPIAPYDTKLEKVHYLLGCCPEAEDLSRETLNLPTHINISEKEAKIIVDFLKPWK